MHPIKQLIEKTRAPTIYAPSGIEDYVNSPKFFIRRAAEALHTAHFGPKDLKHSALNRAARYRCEAIATARGRKNLELKILEW